MELDPTEPQVDPPADPVLGRRVRIPLEYRDETGAVLYGAMHVTMDAPVDDVTFAALRDVGEAALARVAGRRVSEAGQRDPGRSTVPGRERRREEPPT